MEVLDSLWNLLTTENEMLTKIITAPTVIIEAFLLFILATSILKINYTHKQKNIYICLLSLNSLITEFIIPAPYNVFINYLIMFIVIKSVLHTNIIKTALAIIAPTVIFALVGIITLKSILIIFNLTSYEAQYTPIYKFIYLTVLYAVPYLLTKFAKKLDFGIFSTETLDSSNKKIIILNLILGFFTLGLQLIVTTFYSDILPFTITILSFISFFAYFFISFYILNRVIKLQIAQRDLQNAEAYNKTLSILYDNVKSFKHDFDNMVFTIGGFINSNDMNGLASYYESLEKECQQINNISLLNPILINNPGIYNLLTAKYQKAKAENVKIQLDFFFDLNKLHIPIYDFSRMLGIFLDNAIEAASGSSEKIVKIAFRDTSKSNVQIIQIENSYENKHIDTKAIFQKGVTEKNNHLGMGLWEVKQILKRNNNVNLITENSDLYFKQCLEIYY